MLLIIMYILSTKIHIIVTNDTKDDINLVIKSNKSTKIYKIPHCPSNWALNGIPNGANGRINPTETESLIDEKGKSYKNYRWEDMPFDKEYIISDNPDFIVCFQNNEQIRYVSFDGKEHKFSQIHE